MITTIEPYQLESFDRTRYFLAIDLMGPRAEAIVYIASEDRDDWIEFSKGLSISRALDLIRRLHNAEAFADLGKTELPKTSDVHEALAILFDVTEFDWRLGLIEYV